jgi:hypothetical protein
LFSELQIVMLFFSKMTKLLVLDHVTPWFGPSGGTIYQGFLDSRRFGLELLPESDGERLSNHIGPSMKQTH